MNPYSYSYSFSKLASVSVGPEDRALLIDVRCERGFWERSIIETLGYTRRRIENENEYENEYEYGEC